MCVCMCVCVCVLYGLPVCGWRRAAPAQREKGGVGGELYKEGTSKQGFPPEGLLRAPLGDRSPCFFVPFEEG